MKIFHKVVGHMVPFRVEILNQKNYYAISKWGQNLEYIENILADLKS